MYKKLDCVCGHIYEEHVMHDPMLIFLAEMSSGVNCMCPKYDPAGHNPELENVLCPRCRLARLEKPAEKTYVCLACQYVMLESQVLRLVG